MRVSRRAFAKTGAALGGTLDVRSAPDQGTTVSGRIPIAATSDSVSP